MISSPDVRLIHDSSSQYYKISMLSLDQLEHLEVKIDEVQPIIVNMSFAVELILKTLYYKEKNRYKNIHQFDKLFNSLSEESKEAIEQVYPKYLLQSLKTKKLLNYKMNITKGDEEYLIKDFNVNNLAEVLKVHGNSFQHWRYIFELPDNSTIHIFDMRAMVAFYKAVRARFYFLQFGIPV